MSSGVSDIVSSYLRELTKFRMWFVACYAAVAFATMAGVFLWPKTYTSFSTIYADNSNILQPLLEDNAVTTSIEDQARMAQEIIFKRDYVDEVLKAAGYDVASLTSTQKEDYSQSIQGKTQVTNIGRSPASLIRIAHSDSNPVRAFSIAQKYTSLFIEESVVEKRQESKSAFEFIQNQVTTYHAKLQESEKKLSDFKSKNNNGTLNDANARISRYRAEIESLELELVQLRTEETAVDGELSGEKQVSHDLSEMAALRDRINSLQLQLDTLKSRYHDNYPDVVYLQSQIDDLMTQYETGDPGLLVQEKDVQKQGVTTLHQQLRSQMAAIKTSIQSKTSQLEGIRALLDVEMQRITQINEADAQLAELTRDYNVTRDFYNDMLKKLENARVSMHLDEEQQGVTFKVQESAVIPTQPDGASFIQLLLGSLVLALACPLGLLVLYMELDPRIRSEGNFSEEWPPLLMVIPPLATTKKKKISDKLLVLSVMGATVVTYGAAFLVNTL